MEERGLLPEGQNDFVLAYSLSHGLGKFILMQFFRGVLLTIFPIRVKLRNTALSRNYFIIHRLQKYRPSRKGLDIIYRLSAVAQAFCALGLKVNDRPIRYFLGKPVMTSV